MVIRLSWRRQTSRDAETNASRSGRGASVEGADEAAGLSVLKLLRCRANAGGDGRAVSAARASQVTNEAGGRKSREETDGKQGEEREEREAIPRGSRRDSHQSPSPHGPCLG